jgi:hypothetical protein
MLQKDEETSWADRVKNEEALLRVKKGRNTRRGGIQEGEEYKKGRNTRRGGIQEGEEYPVCTRRKKANRAVGTAF